MKKSILLVCLFVASGLLSMSPAHAAKLGDRETMLEQLAQVTPRLNASEYLKERYLPLLLEYAGSEKDAEGIVQMFLDIQRSFYSKYLEGKNSYILADFGRFFTDRTPILIDALFPEDPKEAGQAIRLYSQQYE